jgi:pre-mRNA-splicing factor CWC26
MASAKVIDQKEYLKRYLSGKDKGGKKKRKKSKAAASTGRGLSIVDDNLVAATIDVEEEETNLYELAENAPAVAGVYDDRPIHVQARETFGAKWKSLAPDEPEVSEDVSPPRKASPEPARKKRRRDSDSDASPPRRKASPDFSPPRRKSKSPARRNSSRRSASPPRRRPVDSRRDRRESHRRRSNSRSPPSRTHRSRDSSPPRRSDPKPSRFSRDADLSPPRRSNKRGKSPDSDISPPRNNRRARRNSDSDLSPPRLNVKIKQEPVDSDEEAAGCTLEGKKAGLQDARAVKAELEALRKKEHEHFQKMDDHVSGRGAQAVYRDRKSGRRRDLQQEEQQTAEEQVTK